MSANASDPMSSSSPLTPQGQKSSSRLREKQVLFEVFDNPSLREEILQRVIIGSYKNVDLRTARTLRLVQKSWDQSVLRILWKLHEPLFEVASGTGGNLDDAINTFAAAHYHALPPPLNLDLFSFQYERREILQFSTFVTKCAPAILQMDIEIDEARATPRWILSEPRLSFSRLHKVQISLKLGPAKLMALGEQKQGGGAGELGEGRLIESMFCGATALAELELSIFDHSLGAPAAGGTFLESLTLPPTLIKIKLEIDLEVPQATALLNALVNTPLPKVTSFSLTTRKAIFSNGQLLFSIFNKWKTVLRELAIEGNFDEPEILCPIRFPVIEQLEEFSVRWMTAVLEEVAGPESLERCLPKLRTLRLRRQSPELLREWTESSKFEGMTHLELILADEDNVDDEDETDDNLVSVSAELMQLVNAVFTNLRKLGLGISSSDPSGLKYVFMEMRQLEELELHVFGNLYDPYGDVEETDPWDLILTGLSADMLASSGGRGDPDCLEENGEILVSITNLQELKLLRVKDSRSFLIRSKQKYVYYTSSLISDAVFEHAYLKMPKLTLLFFEGPFEASEEMSDKWERDPRRRLICLPPFWDRN